jgi:type IV secretory pathway VirB10-like protein
MSEPPYGPPYRPSQPAYPQQQQPGPPRNVVRPAQPYPPQPYPQQYAPQPQPRPARRPDVETTSQVRAAMAARSELGPEYDEAIAAGLADRVEELVAYRTAELRHADEATKEDRVDRRRAESHRFVLGIISLGTGVPITAIAASSVDPGLFGVIAAWAGIVGVNAVFALGNRGKRRS